MRAVLPSMIEAEQYLSADRLMALATFLSFIQAHTDTLQDVCTKRKKCRTN
jgi:hypothetical protein